MNRKLTLSVVAVLSTLCCAGGLAACGDGDKTPSHTHDYGTEWITDADSHWHECKNDGCDEKVADKAAHADTDSDGKCDVCGYTLAVIPEIVAVDSVTLDKEEVNLGTGEEVTLVASVAPENATDKSLVWSSSEPAVATVDENGKVTALAAGSTVITAGTADGKKKATCTVTVSKQVVPVQFIFMVKTEIGIDKGESALIGVTVTPEDATNKVLIWKSADVGIATVDEDGRVTGVSVGTTTVTATSVDSGKSVTCTVNVYRPIEAFGLDKTSLVLETGSEQTLTPLFTPAEFTNRTLIWTSSDESVATVSDDGTVTAVAEGTAVINAITVNEIKATCTVTVVLPESAGLVYTAITEGDETVAYAVSSIGTAKDKKITVPERHDGKPVTKIAARAFYNALSITGLSLPSTLTEIGDYAFNNCTGLTEVTIPENVKTIGNYAFAGCSKLTGITVPDGVQTLGASAFLFCNSLESAIIGSGVTQIAANTFQNCTSLKNISIGENVTVIGDSAFQNCTSLISAVIPDKVTEIGKSTFSSCINLLTVTVGSGVKTVGTSAFSGCYRLIEVYNKSTLTLTVGGNVNGYIAYYAKNVYTAAGGSKLVYENGFAVYDKTLLAAYIGEDTLVTVPEAITAIAVRAFQNCTEITGIVIGSGVEEIGNFAFSGCTKLATVYYEGTEEEWAEVTVGSNNTAVTEADIMFYSEEEPEEEGKFWHYGEDGKISTEWEAE